MAFTDDILVCLIKKCCPARAGVAQLVGHRPAKRKVTDRFNSWSGCVPRFWVWLLASRVVQKGNELINVSLPFTLPSPLSRKKKERKIAVPVVLGMGLGAHYNKCKNTGMEEENIITH